MKKKKSENFSPFWTFYFVFTSLCVSRSLKGIFIVFSRRREKKSLLNSDLKNGLLALRLQYIRSTIRASRWVWWVCVTGRPVWTIFLGGMMDDLKWKFQCEEKRKEEKSPESELFFPSLLFCFVLFSPPCFCRSAENEAPLAGVDKGIQGTVVPTTQELLRQRWSTLIQIRFERLHRAGEREHVWAERNLGENTRPYDYRWVQTWVEECQPEKPHRTTFRAKVQPTERVRHEECTVDANKGRISNTGSTKTSHSGRRPTFRRHVTIGKAFISHELAIESCSFVAKTIALNAQR